MTRDEWIERITEHCKSVGTYKKEFDDVIATLAETIVKREEVDAMYRQSGSRPVLPHTNKAGATNLSKNPLLILWVDLNNSALAYWRDLGLTPSGLKKIDENLMKPKKRNKLEEVLKEFD